MPTLTFVTPDGAESAFELEGELSVGREAGNDVVLPEGGLSRRHCRFFQQDGEVYVEDLGSSNGTYVDGQRIAGPTPVAPGQEILLANIKAQLQAQLQAQPKAQPKAQPGAGRSALPPRRAAGLRAGSSARTGMLPKAAPAALARRPPSAPARVPGRALPARRSSASVLAEREAEVSEATGARASLKGLTGPWAGQTFRLGKTASVVGRIDGNDVVIADDSVSRRHAEIHRSGSGYRVRDLQSANGTFLNGERIAEAPLRPGDVLKLGVVELSYSGPSMGRTAASGAAPALRKKILAVGGSAAVFLLLVGVILKVLAPPPGASPDGPAAVPAGPDVTQLLGMCKAFTDTDGNTLDFGRAIGVCDQVLKIDPINADARKLKKLAEKEVAQGKIFDQAHRLYSLGQDEAALEVYVQLENDSYYYRQGRSDFKKAAPIVMRRAADLCLSQWKNRYSEKAWPECKRYADIACYLGLEEKYKRPFDELQREYRGKDEWVCPERYKRFLTDVTGGTALADERKGAIEGAYPDKGLAAAVVKFAVDPVIGMNQIQKYIAHGGKESARARQVFQSMAIDYSKHQEGVEKLLQGDLKAAAVEWKAALEADQQIMPKGFSSDTAQQMRSEISDKLAKTGKILFTQGRYPESFAQCAAGGEFTLANPAILECFSDLENAASGLVGGDCDGVTKALAITRGDSPTHKAAEKRKVELGCP